VSLSASWRREIPLDFLIPHGILQAFGLQNDTLTTKKEPEPVVGRR